MKNSALTIFKHYPQTDFIAANFESSEIDKLH